MEEAAEVPGEGLACRMQGPGVLQVTDNGETAVRRAGAEVRECLSRQEKSKRWPTYSIR